MREIVIQLDEGNDLSLGHKNVDAAELIYMLSASMVQMSKKVGLTAEEAHELIEEGWELE